MLQRHDPQACCNYRQLCALGPNSRGCARLRLPTVVPRRSLLGRLLYQQMKGGQSLNAARLRS